MIIYTKDWSQNYDHFSAITGEGNSVEGDERNKLIEEATHLAYFQSGGRGGYDLLQLPDGRLILSDDDSGYASVSTEPVNLIELNQALEEYKNAPLVNDECIGFKVLYYCTGCNKIYKNYILDFIASGSLFVATNKAMRYEDGYLDVAAGKNTAKCVRYLDPLHSKKNKIITLYCDVEKYNAFFMGKEDTSTPLTIEDIADMLSPDSRSQLGTLLLQNL